MLAENQLRRFFADTCEGLLVKLEDDEISKFFQYKDLLVSWNAKFNLTAITDSREILIKHFADSLAVLPFIAKNASVIDVGTGAGFPGIPLKIAERGISLTLLDSLKKRAVFLEEVSNKLCLADVSVVCARAEDAARNSRLREHYDAAVSRAVAPLNILAEYCLPFVKVGGVFLAMKGGNTGEEIEGALFAVDALGGVIKSVNRITIEGNSRSVIVIEKIRKTPPAYPRKAGRPAKRPLCAIVEKRK